MKKHLLVKLTLDWLLGSFKYSKLGCEHPMWCTHSHWKGWRFANLYPHHLMHICKEGEDDLQWHLLRVEIKQDHLKTRNLIPI